MLVARSFKYSSSPEDRVLLTSNDHSHHHSNNSANMRGNSSSRRAAAVREPASPTCHTMPSTTAPVRPSISPLRAKAEPVMIPSPNKTAERIPPLPRTYAPRHPPSHMAQQRRGGVATLDERRRTGRNVHDPNSLPPAVAALLAMTAIPPRRPNRYRTRSKQDQQPVSIEELVSSWKSDDSLQSSWGSPGLSMLLDEDADEDVLLVVEGEEQGGIESPKCASSSVPEENYFNARSSSSESMPSLEADDRSVISFGSLSTPESLRSRKSLANLRREHRLRAVSIGEECSLDHPLAAPLKSDNDDEDNEILHLPLRNNKTVPPRKTSSFKSNLTSSLQSLKNAALSSISSLGRSSSFNTISSLQRSSSSSTTTAQHQIDDALWSHPFLFPRLSSEVRPATGTQDVSAAQRRYLNPLPLTFEEQEAPFQKALHEPFLREMINASEDENHAPTIQMQTYNRRGGPRKASSRRSGGAPDPKSEAGRALLGARGALRQREVRENSDFLRIVVMEMNMRRVGKLDSGRAKIWLPPRQATAHNAVSSRAGSVPARWAGVSAY